MKCCTLPDGAKHTGGHKKKGVHHGRISSTMKAARSKFTKAAKSCKGKHHKAYLKCMKAKLKK